MPVLLWHIPSPSPEHVMIAVQGRDVTDVLPLVFGEQCNSLREVAYATNSVSVQGYVTVPPASFGHKHRQYLYVNNRHVRAAQLGKLVNSLFRCVMSKLERPEEARGKAAQQYPAFALQITCPHSSYDITSEPDKSHVEFADWQAVMAAMQAAILDAWHSAVGDKLLAELLQDQHCKAEAPASVATASASTEHATAASCKHESQLLPLSKSKARHSSPAIIGVKRKCDQEQASFFMDTDIVSVNTLFDKSTRRQKCQTSTDLTANADNPNSTNDIQDDSALQSLPPQTAPRGLLHRLQSSVKLKFVPVPPAQRQDQSHQQQEPAVSLTAKDSDDAAHLELANLLDDEPEAQPAMDWPPSEQYTDQVLPAAVRQVSDADRALASPLVLPATSFLVNAPSHHADRQAKTESSRSICHRACKRRAVSAPPHYRTQHHSAHTNPLHSLHTDLHELVPPYKASVRAQDALTAQAASTAEQAPHEWVLNRQARQQHTVSGVCNQLRPQLGKSGQVQLSEVYRQKRKSSSRSCLKPAQTPSSAHPSDRLAQSHCSEHPAVADNAVHDSSLEHQTSRKRVRFEQSMNPAPAKNRAAEPLPSVPMPYIPNTPHSTLSAAQPPKQQGPGMPMTATPSASTAARRPAQPVEPEIDVLLAQQTSLAVPSITELLQSWSNPSICPQRSRSIADLASVCGSGLHAVVPTAISRSDFTQAQTLRQMENKFIAMVCNGTLCVIDQHAADERVRLERLRAAVLGLQVS